MTRRDPIASTLADPKYHQRVVPGKSKPNYRKKNDSNLLEDLVDCVSDIFDIFDD